MPGFSGKVRIRCILLIAAHFGDGPLTDQIADLPGRWLRRQLMPPKPTSTAAPTTGRVGGKPSFARSKLKGGVNDLVAERNGLRVDDV